MNGRGEAWRRRGTWGLSAFAALLLAGCITNPLGSDGDGGTPTDRKAITLPPAPPRLTSLDAASAREHQRLVAAFGGEYRAPQVQALLDTIVQRLGQATERPSERYPVTLLNSPVSTPSRCPTATST